MAVQNLSPDDAVEFFIWLLPLSGPSAFMEMVICEQGGRALEGGHPPTGGSHCSQVIPGETLGVPRHQWIEFCCPQPP